MKFAGSRGPSMGQERRFRGSARGNPGGWPVVMPSITAVWAARLQRGEGRKACP
jgi:hypothetical protein